MAFLGQNLFLQALGWATLNSIWQMGLLWGLYVGAQHLTKLSAARKYNLSLLSLALGLVWFAVTFLNYYSSGAIGTLSNTSHSAAPTSATWSVILSSASITYLLLLVFPAIRLVQNYRFVGKLKTVGLQKTDLHYRLFVQKVALRLGIKKEVHVYLSSLVHSPVTIGYVKPIILLPVAALNHLSIEQTEAILLHELAHIRRSDFLINLIVNLIHTLFYYNPFVRLFVAAIDTEREKCCDETVLQFEYDKVSYATALLTLEKNAAAPVLAIGAAGKNHLLKRIEKIVGMEKKTTFSFTHFAGLMATLLLIILINSLLFVSKPVERNKNMALVAFENPFYNTMDRGELLMPPQPKADEEQPALMASAKTLPEIKVAANQKVITKNGEAGFYTFEHFEAPENPDLINVAFNETKATVTTQEKIHVDKTVQATKKVLAQTQWEAVEKEIADAMTEKEKALARQQYMTELEKVDWQKLEEKLKTQYKQMDWERINMNLNKALVDMKLDSLQQVYAHVLSELEKAESCAQSAQPSLLAVPDASQAEVKAIKVQLRNRIDSIRIIRNKEVISL